MPEEVNEVNVTNNLDNATVVVANRHIAPKESRNLPERDVKDWYFKKGGERLVKAEIVTIDAAQPDISIGLAAADAADEAPETFDGAPVTLLPTPEERRQQEEQEVGKPGPEKSEPNAPPLNEGEGDEAGKPGPDDLGDFSKPSTELPADAAKPAKRRAAK